MEESHATSEVKIPADADEDGDFEFEPVSCFVISKHSKPRRWIIQLMKWPYPFENSTPHVKYALKFEWKFAFYFIIRALSFTFNSYSEIYLDLK